MKFALQHHLTGVDNFVDAFKIAKELGFDGVEVAYFGKALDNAVTSEIRRASEASGIPSCAVCGGYRHWIGEFDPDKRADAVRDIVTSLQYVAEIGASGLIAPAAYGMFSKRLPPFHPPRDTRGDREALIDSLKTIAETAEKHNVYLYLEPLNRYEDHMINTVAEAVSIIEEVGSSRIQAMADFFHMNVEESDIGRTIEDYISFLGHFHLADSNRLQPGRGHTDFHSALTRLKQLNYNGFLSLECGVSGERRESLEQSLAYLQNLTNSFLKEKGGLT
jgi:sugar phosphate isomerase/epimerase